MPLIMAQIRAEGAFFTDLAYYETVDPDIHRFKARHNDISWFALFFNEMT